MRRAVIAVMAGLAIALVVAAPASAHPLGNFTVNTAAAIELAPEGVVVNYAVDLAEIPTLRAKHDLDANGDGTITDDEQQRYLAGECARIAAAVKTQIDGRDVGYAATGRTIALVDGLAGLATMRLECQLSAAVELRAGTHALTFDDGYASGRVGWHEVTARGDGTRLVRSDVPTDSPSAALTHYPSGIASPPDVRHASLSVEPGGDRLDASRPASAVPGAHSSVPGVDRATRAFAGLITKRNLTVRVGFTAVVVAFVLGAFHAAAPGHGKTVMAAYLVGQRGTLRQALGVGAGVTLTHTAGVLVLGLMLSVSSVVAPERLYPWLGAISGVLLASIGVALLRRARRLRRMGAAAIWHSHHHHDAPDHHHHGHHDHHHHHDHDHDHDQDHDHHDQPTADAGPLGWRWVMAMGFAGGMVPSPSALVVLLGAVALGRTWFGVGLVLAYGLGMATTLMIAGLVLVRARARLERIVETDRGRRLTRVLTVMPAITATVITAGGVLLAARALESL